MMSFSAKEEAPAAVAAWGPMAATHAIQSDDDALNRGGPRASSGAPSRATPAQLPDPILSAIRGEEVASAVIRDARSDCAGVDALRDAILAVVGANDPELLRAFARRVQKVLERSAVSA